MNGRLALTISTEQLERFMGVKTNAKEVSKHFANPLYNIAPPASLAVVTNLQQDRIRFLKWGLIPGWSGGGKNSKGLSTIEIQQFGQKPALQKSLKNKRCLIVASGFFLWKDSPAGKIPYYIRLKTNEPFCIGGLWESWEEEESGSTTCCLLTQKATGTLSYFPSELPWVLHPSEHGNWLKKDIEHLDTLSSYQLIQESDFEYYPVNRKIVKNLDNDPRYIQKITYVVAEQTSLF